MCICICMCTYSATYQKGCSPSESQTFLPTMPVSRPWLLVKQQNACCCTAHLSLHQRSKCGDQRLETRAALSMECESLIMKLLNIQVSNGTMMSLLQQLLVLKIAVHIIADLRPSLPQYILSKGELTPISSSSGLAFMIAAYTCSQRASFSVAIHRIILPLSKLLRPQVFLKKVATVASSS